MDEERKWQGYSDYKSVAAKIHADINEATNWYSFANARLTAGKNLKSKHAIRTKTTILRIAKRLYVEIERNNHVEPFDEMYERWSDKGGEPGYIDELESLNLKEEWPDWMSGFVTDIVDAGWELGYLKSGRERPASPDSDKQQARSMYE